jgi:hypothetical protein
LHTDYHEVEALLQAGRLGAALERYRHPLVPSSETPLVEEARARLDGGLRTAVISSADPALLTVWCETSSGRDDQPAAELLLSLLDPRDERLPAARARTERLRRRGAEDLPPAW